MTAAVGRLLLIQHVEQEPTLDEGLPSIARTNKAKPLPGPVLLWQKGQMAPTLTRLNGPGRVLLPVD